ncbi:MAG: ATP-binding protein [Caulobacteraceae bacterium]|nr:ATP-binding protein [Caulobacteraceae bacterium]
MTGGCPGAAEAFERRLDPGLAAPVAVGLSGGGDSLAALLAARAWAARSGRPLIALTVDHRLQAASGGWTRFAAETAARLGAGFRALAWEGPKPATGLAAAARLARHRLLADAARQAGAGVLVLGHTADDLLEAEVMRGWGSSLGAMREWSPSPVWPQGRGLFILRPLLGQRRAALRAWLASLGERWIDDPANDDLAQTRARARAALAGGGEAPDPATDDPDAACLAAAVVAVGGGALRLDRAALASAPAAAARRVLAAAALSAGGGPRPPRSARLEALRARLAAPGPVRATLCGARVIGEAEAVLVARDAGEARRGGLAPIDLPPGEAVVWDGRFEITGQRAGLAVRPLAGLAARLDPAQRSALRALPAAVRPALPVVVDAQGLATCPILADGPAAACDLVRARTWAACGVIAAEQI